jgi:hypothetical protein
LKIKLNYIYTNLVEIKSNIIKMQPLSSVKNVYFVGYYSQL